MKIKDSINKAIHDQIKYSEGEAISILNQLRQETKGGYEVNRLLDEDTNNIVAHFLDILDRNQNTYIWNALDGHFYFTSENDFIDMMERLDDDADLDEATTSMSSGSYGTPLFIDEQTFNTLLKKSLLKEYVYPAQKETFENAKLPKKETATKITATPAHKSENNEGKTQNDDQRIEGHQNGMQDLEYDSISEDDKTRMKNEFKAGDTKESKPGEVLLKDADKRAKTKKEASNTISLGSDVEITDEKPKEKKKISETLKVYKVKTNLPIDEQLVTSLLETNQKALKGKKFIFEDQKGNRLNIDWTASLVKVTKGENIIKRQDDIALNKKLFESFSGKKEEVKNKMNENEFFDVFMKFRKK